MTMTLRLLLIAAFLLVAMPAQAQSVQDVLENAVKKTTAPKPEPKRKTIPASRAKPKVDTAPVKPLPAAPGLPDMQSSKNVSYGDDPAQTLDVYAPYGSGSAPAVVVIQSTDWTQDPKAAPRAMTQKIRHWTGKGVIFVTLRTRTLPGTDVAGQAEDVARAVFYLKENLKRWGGDPARIGVIGYDAGAHLLMLAASDATINRGVMWQASVALGSPLYDVRSLMLGRPTWAQKKVFGQDDGERWAALSPYSRINGPTAPALLVCTAQVRDACLQAQKYQEKSQRKGNIVTVLPVEKDHAQMDADLGAAGPYTDMIDQFFKKSGVLP